MAMNTRSMHSYELPIVFNRLARGFSITVAISEGTVISRQVSEADLRQLQVHLAEVLGDRQRVPRDRVSFFAYGRSTMPSVATTEPGRRFATSAATLSMKASSCAGSWWKTT